MCSSYGYKVLRAIIEKVTELWIKYIKNIWDIAGLSNTSQEEDE
jgi:hypothetical protein